MGGTALKNDRSIFRTYHDTRTYHEFYLRSTNTSEKNRNTSAEKQNEISQGFVIFRARASGVADSTGREVLQESGVDGPLLRAIQSGV